MLRRHQAAVLLWLKCEGNKMYIEKTNLEERAIIEDAVNDIFARIESAHFLLDEEMEKYFLSIEQKSLTKWEAESLGIHLRIVADLIFDSLLQYHLTVGHSDWRGVHPHLEGAERAQKAIEAETAQNKMIDIERKFRDTPKGKELTEARNGVQHLPDNQAIIILETLTSNVNN